MKQIVCLSTSPWYPIPTRKQQVMSRIEDAQILYFDPPVSILAPLKDPQARKRIFAYRKPAQTVAPNPSSFCLAAGAAVFQPVPNSEQTEPKADCQVCPKKDGRAADAGAGVMDVFSYQLRLRG